MRIIAFLPEAGFGAVCQKILANVPDHANLSDVLALEGADVHLVHEVYRRMTDKRVTRVRQLDLRKHPANKALLDLLLGEAENHATVDDLLKSHEFPLAAARIYGAGIAQQLVDHVSHLQPPLSQGGPALFSAPPLLLEIIMHQLRKETDVANLITTTLQADQIILYDSETAEAIKVL